jgi:hypothetical protein
MFCLQVVSEDEDFIESGLRNETMAVWSEVTPSGEPDGALLAAMPAEWQAPLHPIARSPSVAMSRAPSVAGTTDGSDAVPGTQPGTPGSEEPPDSPVDPVDPIDDRPDYWLVCTNFRYGEQCGEATNGNSQFCRNCQLGL